MYLRKVREGVRAKKSSMEPVWITCDDLNAEGILVRKALLRHLPVCGLRPASHASLISKVDCMSEFGTELDGLKATFQETNFNLEHGRDPVAT